MPEGQFRITGPLLYKLHGNHHAYRTDMLDNGRWRRIGITFFGNNKRKTKKEIEDNIQPPLLLRGPVHVQILRKAALAGRRR